MAKTLPIKRVSLSEDVFRNVLTFSQLNGKNDFRLNAFFFPISINLSENVLKRLANQHRLQKTSSIGLETWLLG